MLSQHFDLKSLLNAAAGHCIIVYSAVRSLLSGFDFKELQSTVIRNQRTGRRRAAPLCHVAPVSPALLRTWVTCTGLSLRGSVAPWGHAVQRVCEQAELHLMRRCVLRDCEQFFWLGGGCSTTCGHVGEQLSCSCSSCTCLLFSSLTQSREPCSEIDVLQSRQPL